MKRKIETNPLLRLCAIALLLSPFAASLSAQTMDDGIMLASNQYCSGVFYTYDTWDHYWEGGNFRANANIGAVTTRTLQYVGNYGLTKHVNILFNIPHVATSSSQGVLHGQRGWQDFSLAAKVKLFSLPVRHWGALRGIAVVSAGTPMSAYTADDEPMSIGAQSNQLTGRAMANYLGHNGVYINASSAYTFRNNVQLSRPEYYTSGQLYLSSQVAIPNQFLWAVSTGYRRNDTTLVATYQQQQTRGGGDIRPQDAPFVSNRQNASRFGGTVTLPVPHLHALQYWAVYSYALRGRNIGQSNSATVGFLYTISWHQNGGTK